MSTPAGGPAIGVRVVLEPGERVLSPQEVAALGKQAAAALGAGPAPVDPRVGKLMDFAQGLINELGELTTLWGAHVPDQSTRVQLTRKTETVVRDAIGALTAIALGAKP
jgi:hypothetical protein